MSSIVGTTLGHYKLLDEIGSGGFATVYLALDTRVNEPVAVKVLLDREARDPTAVARFEREAQSLGKLPSHPNIVGLRDHGRQNGMHYLVMDYVSGNDLSQVVHEHGRLPVTDAVNVVLQTASALKSAYEAGVIHRDIKPENIRLLPEGVVKLLDFGIARDTASTRLTKSGLLAGTSPYVAPEVWRGQQPSHASDIYALGCVFYEMLAGHPPFNAETPEAIMRLHLEEPPDTAQLVDAGAPAGVCDAIEQMLAKDPAARPSTDQLLESLPPYGRPRKGAAAARAAGGGASPDPARRSRGAGKRQPPADPDGTRVNLRTQGTPRPGARRVIGTLALVLAALAAGLALGVVATAHLGLPAVIDWRARELEPTPAAAARSVAGLFRGTPLPPVTTTLILATAPVSAAESPATAVPTRTAEPQSMFAWIPGRLRRLPGDTKPDYFIDDTSPGLTLDPALDSAAGERIWGRLDYTDTLADYGTGYVTIRAGDTASIIWSMDLPLPAGNYEIFVYRPTHDRQFVAEVVPYEVRLDSEKLAPFAGSNTVNQQASPGGWISIGGYELKKPGLLAVHLNSEAARPLKYEVDVDSIAIARLQEPKLLAP